MKKNNIEKIEPLANMHGSLFKRPPSFQVFITSSYMNTLTIRIRSTDSILTLKNKICSRIDIDVGKLRLMYGGHVCKNKEKISATGIHKESTIFLSIKGDLNPLFNMDLLERKSLETVRTDFKRLSAR